MFLLFAVLIGLFIYNILYFFKILYQNDTFMTSSGDLNFDNSLKTNKKNDNVIILEKLGYYGININEIKLFFILECMNYLLNNDNPNYINYVKNSKFYKYNNEQIEKLSENFQQFCSSIQKNKMDLSMGEIKKFIIKSEAYKNIERELFLKLKRAVLLSKFTNEITANKLINSLTIEELEFLTKNSIN
jgi:hypothetical protein